MDEESKPKTLDDCPIEFRWATFCRTVLTSDEEEKSLIGVLNAAKIDALVQGADAAQLPDVIPFSMGSMAIFAIFSRKVVEFKRLETRIHIKSNMPSLNDQQLSLVVGFEPHHLSSQQILKIPNLVHGIPREPHVEELEVGFYWEDLFMGAAKFTLASRVQTDQVQHEN